VADLLPPGTVVKYAALSS